MPKKEMILEYIEKNNGIITLYNNLIERRKLCFRYLLKKKLKITFLRW